MLFAALRRSISLERDPNRWSFFGVAWAAWLTAAGLGTVAATVLYEKKPSERKQLDEVPAKQSLQ